MTIRIPALSAMALSAALVLSAANANANVITFTGTATNIGSTPVASAACSPLLITSFGPANTAGTSNLGAFTYTQAHCTTGGPGTYTGGVFQYFFDLGDSLEGSYSGLASLSGTPGLLNNTINLVVTSGTGRFLGGSGTITGIGTVDFRNGAPVQNLTLNGSLNLPAVPEPATWLLLVGGFASIGAMLRRRRVPTPMLAA
jgi:hypothetical protein